MKQSLLASGYFQDNTLTHLLSVRAALLPRAPCTRRATAPR